MYLFHNVPLPYEDEHFRSWFRRLLEWNGFSAVSLLGNRQGFYERFDIHYGHDYITGLIPFLEMMQMPMDVYDFIENCTLFPLHVGLSDDGGLNAHILRLLYVNPMLTDNTPKNLTSSFKICPECKKEDPADFYCHTSHQIPGLSLCPKHLVALIDEKTGQPVTCTAEFGIQEKYTAFALALRRPPVSFNSETLLDVLKNKAEIQIKTLFCKEMEELLNRNGYGAYAKKITRLHELKTLGGYMYIQTLISICACLFKSPEELFSCFKGNASLPFPEKEKKYMPLKNQGFLWQVNHLNCNRTFYTTPALFFAGWKCPECMGTNEVEFFKQVLFRAGNGEYAFFGDSVSLCQRTGLIHECGKVFYVTPSDFLLQKKRCSCTRKKDKVKDVSLLKKLNNFTLDISNKFSKASYAKCKNCGYIYDLNKILENPVCRICRTDFKEQSESKAGTSRKHKTKKEILWNYLTATYKKDELIFVEDIPQHLQVKQRTFHLLEEEGKIHCISVGIYAFCGYEPKAREILHNKLILRKNKRLGGYVGKSFLYNIGYYDKCPSCLYCFNNDSVFGGIYSYAGDSCKYIIKKSPVLLTDDNFITIAILDVLSKFKTYLNKDDSGDFLMEKLKLCALSHGLTANDFNAYKQYFPTAQFIDEFTYKLSQPTSIEPNKHAFISNSEENYDK